MKQRHYSKIGLVLSMSVLFFFAEALAEGNQPTRIPVKEITQNSDTVLPVSTGKLMKAYQKLAEQGVVNAQVTLARNYGVGTWGHLDLAMAAHWFERAAELGDQEAQVILGWMYAEGRGVSPDSALAVHWYRQAAVQGVTKAQVNLAFCYATGNGVSQDNRQAVYWLTQAATLGDDKAQYMLGVHYLKGEGIVQSSSTALQWFQKAARQGHAKAQKTVDWLARSGLVFPGEGKGETPRVDPIQRVLQPGSRLCKLSTDCRDGYLCDEMIRKCITNLEWIRKYPDM